MKRRFTMQERRLIDYLSGSLPETERQALAERIFTDDEYYEELRAAEEELIDAYTRGELADAEARLVEALLLETTEGRRKWRTSEALRRREVVRMPSRRRAVWLAAAAIVAAVGVFLMMHREHPGGQPSTMPPAIVLRLDVARGESRVEQVAIPPADGAVRFAVPIAEADRGERYEVRVRTPAGKDLLIQGRESAGQVEFTIPRADVAPGRHEFAIYANGRMIAAAPVEFK